MKTLLKFSLIMTFLIIQSCSSKPISLESVNIEPYFKDEGGKFITMCLSEPLENRKSIYVKFHFVSNTKKEYEYGSTFYGKNEKCLKFNVFVNLAHRHSNKKDMDFLKNQLNNGNIKELKVEIYDDYGGESLFSKVFYNL